MTWRTAVFAALAAVGAVSTGCAPPLIQEDHGLLLTQPDTLSTYKLAGRLDMTVTSQSPTMVSLHDGRNSVVIFAGPEGRLYVNGRHIAAARGSVARANGMLFVPVSYEPVIRAERVPPPPPRVPVPAPEAAAPTALAGRVVVIDPGHGGKDPGATSVHGQEEKAVVLEVAQLVTDGLLGRGVDAHMTRQDDRFIELEERSAIANRLRAELFVSIHADAARNRAARGFTVYVARQPGPASLAAADAIARLLQASGVPSRGRQEANYRVLVGTTCPAVLVELGYLSNADEAARLAVPGYRRQLADAIADAIAEYLQRP
ncbi:MAG: N-acetylmuramoyl-L-alanine amidase [Phycisphaerae bacterium]|nr:N-acetylmuramoyl-L-alanine amidase [Phycisphaerae bacterium]